MTAVMVRGAVIFPAEPRPIQRADTLHAGARIRYQGRDREVVAVRTHGGQTSIHLTPGPCVMVPAGQLVVRA